MTGTQEHHTTIIVNQKVVTIYSYTKLENRFIRMLWDHNFQMLDFREEENDKEVKIFEFLGLFYFGLMII